MLRPSKRKNQPESIDKHGRNLLDYQTMRKQCAYCAVEDKENRTFLICLACNIPLCLAKGKNLFPRASYSGVRIIYTLYISLKRCGFLFGFYIFPQLL